MTDVKLTDGIITQLLANPNQSLISQIANIPMTISIAIPNYIEALKRHYGQQLMPDLATIVQRSSIDCKVQHFGLKIQFDQATELKLHDSDNNLLGDLKQLIKRFEVVVLTNAYVEDKFKDIGHRNRFPHLKFHRDRNETQPTPYSLYTRDPRCEEQIEPRQSSTLFIPNIVAYLQCMLERDYQQLQTRGPQSHYDIFYQTDMSQVLDKIILEHPWNQPRGVGEISMLDNRTTLHASYLRNKLTHGYRIGVRYLK